MPDKRPSFFNYIILKRNIGYLLFALAAGVLYFIILRILFPIPSYYSDSFTWIGAANTLQPVTFRPVGYSKLLVLFKLFSESDVALIAAQYFTNLLANLFLFYTCTWFFRLRKPAKILLYVLLILHPFYLFSSNYISSDAFFNSFAVLWFTLLIWIMHKPSTALLIAQILILAGLFFLRYNAVYFPAISALAILLSNQTRWKKAIFITLGFATVFSIVALITFETKKFTGTNTFSAFSGWQLANNGLHVARHYAIDTTVIKDDEVKALLRFTEHFFDTARQTFPDTTATAVYMWHINSPLKRYMQVYPGKKKSYFGTWNAVGPLYANFGRTIILQKPWGYIRHFVLLNATAYLYPDLEIYNDYMEKVDTIAGIAQKFYHYNSNLVPAPHPVIYSYVFEPVKYLFTAINFLLVALTIFYLYSTKYKKQSTLFNKTLCCFIAFFVINFFFVVLLAPTVIRYHIFILTLSLPVLIYLCQQSFNALRPRRRLG